MTSRSNLKRSTIVARIILALAIVASAPGALFAQFGVIFGADNLAAENQFTELALSATGTLAAAEGDRKSVRLWDSETGRLRHKLDGFTGSVWSLSFSGDEKMLAIGDRKGVISLFDTQSGQRLKTLNGHQLPVSCLAFSPNGKSLASGNDEECLLWNNETGDVIHRFPQSKSQTNDIAFLPDGETVLAANLGQPLVDETSFGIKFWNLKSGQSTTNLRLVPFQPRWVAVSPDGKLMAYSSRRLVLLWDLPTRTLLRAFIANDDDWVNRIAFSPDGRHLATASCKNNFAYVMRVWDVATTRQLWQRDFKNDILHLSFTPDGSTIVAGDRESLRMYDFESTTLRQDWFPHGDALRGSDPKVVGAKP